MDPSAAISPDEKRLPIFRAVPLFGTLPAGTVEALASSAIERRYRSGEPIVVEGSRADGMYVIASGKTEVSVTARDGRLPMCVMHEGDLFGEVGMVRAGRRSATVIALGPVTTYHITSEQFEQLLANDPAVHAALETLADKMLIATFIKRISQFRKLSIDHVRRLSEQVVERELAPGEFLFRHGDPGDTCYLVLSGLVEILRAERSEVRSVDHVYPGSVLGEGALLTKAMRTATAVAEEPTRVLSIRRDDFVGILAADYDVADSVVDLMHMRERPTRAKRVTVYQRRNAEGEVETVLQDDIRLGIYHRLSPLGAFVWQRLDGRHNVREIAEEYRAAIGNVEERAIAEIIANLVHAHFAFTKALKTDISTIIAVPWWKRILSRRNN